MQIDNAGASIVFDEKTTEAIEAGKNRINLLQAEELRLSKLVAGLKGDVVKLDEEIEYKRKLEGELKDGITLEKAKLDALVRAIDEESDKYDTVVKNIGDALKRMESEEEEIKERLKSLSVWENDAKEQEKSLADRASKMEEAEAQLKIKVTILEKALSSL